jgi:predicted phosphodiesterase
MASENLTKIAYFGDVHRPYHHRKAWSLFLKVMEDFKPDVLVCLGDLADFYKISSFAKDPSREFNFNGEIEDVNKALDELDNLGASRKIFIAGNHEDRLTRYLQTAAPELFELVDVPTLFKLELRGWEYTPYKSHVKLGKIYMTHDVGSAGRYSLFKAADTFQHPIVVAHTHRFGGIVEGNAEGKCYPAWQFGWLGDVEKVDYAHKVKVKREWSLGFGVGYQNTDSGVTHIQGVPIVNSRGYTCVVNGKEFSV